MNDKEKFETYEKVRQSGVTNMFDLNTVCELSGLTKEDVLFVMKNYTELNKVYENV